jgi:mannose-6-phosphate isomerase-like protein (cupin superfamily)
MDYATIISISKSAVLHIQGGVIMTGFVGKIEALTLKNKYFRKVLYTGKHTQLVLMCLQPGEEIGNEVHKSVDQFFRIEEGAAKFIFNGKETHTARANDAVIVPAGTYHNVINASKTNPVKLYTLYSPPNHPDGTIHKTKADADEAEKHEHHK